MEINGSLAEKWTTPQPCKDSLFTFPVREGLFCGLPSHFKTKILHLRMPTYGQAYMERFLITITFSRPLYFSKSICTQIALLLEMLVSETFVI